MISEIYCKSALSKSKLPGLEYSLNPYYGCAHACIYCYVPSLFRIERQKWHEVKAKKNMPEVLRKELRKKRKGVVGISSSTDAYQPVEKEYKITRECLSLLVKYGWSVDILTKSDLVTRDIDIIKEGNIKGNAKVGVTITTFNEEVLQKWEPYAPLPDKRIDAIKKFSDEDIFTYIFFGPVFPLMKKEELNYCIEEFINAGVNEIVIDSLHLKMNVLESITQAFPEDVYKIKRAVYGDFYYRIFEEAKKFAGRKVNILRAW